MPRRLHRGNSPERNMLNATLLPKSACPPSRGVLESVSDLSLSLGSLGSFSSFFSSTDGSRPNLYSSGETSSSTLSSSLQRKFSTSSRLSLFSSHPPEKKKNRKRGETQKVNRWDSSEECKAKVSPQKPQRKEIEHVPETMSRVREFSIGAQRRVPPRERISSDDSAMSRWSSHSTSQHNVALPPRKTGSPRKPSRSAVTVTPRPPPPFRASAPRRETNREQDIEFNPKLFNHRPLQSEAPNKAEHRAVLSRQSKAYNLLLKDSSHSHPPSTTSPRLPPWNPHSDTIHKLKCPFEWAGSKRSVATCSTSESAASSAACPDYSIPWFAPQQKVGLQTHA